MKTSDAAQVNSFLNYLRKKHGQAGEAVAEAANQIIAKYPNEVLLPSAVETSALMSVRPNLKAAVEQFAQLPFTSKI